MMIAQSPPIKPFTIPCLLALLLGVVACAPQVALRGNLLEEERISEVREGVSRREDVASVLGSPSAKSTLDADETVWYYIGQKTEKTAFFQPDVVEHKIVAISFNRAGVVDKLEQMTLDNARDISPVDRQTPTAGHDLSFFEQILGNVGRFGGKKSSNRPGQPGT
ncbi:Outer membrane protein assembly factor BamE (Lipoprotein component of BamABCDE complex) [Azospirillaceae bacterium]